MKAIIVKTIIFIGRKYGYYCIVMKMSRRLNYPLLARLADFPLPSTLLLNTLRNPHKNYSSFRDLFHSFYVFNLVFMLIRMDRRLLENYFWSAEGKS